MNKTLLLGLVLASSFSGKCFAAEVFDYTADSIFSIKHTKTYSATGVGGAVGFAMTSDSRVVQYGRLESHRIFDIFPDRFPIDSFWLNVSLEGRVQKDKLSESLYLPIGNSISFGPYLSGPSSRWLPDWRFFAGPVLQTVLYANFPDITKADSPPMFGLLAGVWTGVEAFAGKGISFSLGVRWSGGMLSDTVRFFSEVSKMRPSRFFQVFEVSFGTRFYLDV